MFLFLSGYVAVVGFISFAVCYRYGPLVDEKSINILSWTLQLFGLLLVYLGIQIQQVAFAIIVAALFSKNLEYPVSLAVAAFRCVCVHNTDRRWRKSTALIKLSAKVNISVTHLLPRALFIVCTRVFDTAQNDLIISTIF